MTNLTPEQENLFNTAYRLGVMDAERSVARKLLDIGSPLSSVAYLLDASDDYVQRLLEE